MGDIVGGNVVPHMIPAEVVVFGMAEDIALLLDEAIFGCKIVRRWQRLKVQRRFREWVGCYAAAQLARISVGMFERCHPQVFIDVNR